jgi:abnormal spindle-like microcephaly-associated protein
VIGVLVSVLHFVSALGTKNISVSFLQFIFVLYLLQAVCDNYDCPVDSFHSLVDGKAIWCLLDYYFQKELHNVCSLKVVNFFRLLLSAGNNFLLLRFISQFFLQEVYEKSGKTSIMSVNEYSDALYNFILSQKLTTLLGNFPEVNTLICANSKLHAHDGIIVT